MDLNKEIKINFQQVPKLEVKFNEELKKHTTFKIGGPADIFVIPPNINTLQQTLKLIDKYQLPFFILGKGSNIIVGDKGFRGVVINTEKLNQLQVQDNKIIAQTGLTLTDLADAALENSLTGLEFASGIPGSLGGALYMNAGAYGGEIKHIVSQVTCLNHQGEKVELSKEELQLDYRNSILQHQPLIAVQATLQLETGDQNKIKEKMEELTEKRWAKQPMELPSAGSIFKRPEGYYAGALIDEANLKGTNIGDAQVSTKHAGFIINKGKASAQDVKELINHIQNTIYDKTGVKLETEPKFIGEFENKN